MSRLAPAALACLAVAALPLGGPGAASGSPVPSAPPLATTAVPAATSTTATSTTGRAMAAAAGPANPSMPSMPPSAGGPMRRDRRDRLDRVSAELRRDPLYVDPETASLVDADTRTRIRDEIEQAAVPIYAVVIPLGEDDESQGKPNLFLHNLYGRLRAPGVYVVMDEVDFVVAEAFDVPRRVTSLDLNDLGPIGEPDDEPGLQLLDAVRKVAAAPAGERARPSPYETYDEHPGEDPVSVGGMVGLGLAGVIAGSAVTLLLAWLGGLVLRALGVRPRRGGRDRTASRRPERWSGRRLSAAAKRELRELDAELRAARTDQERDLGPALAAFDAAKLLAGDTPGQGELAAVIALARAGRYALGDEGQAGDGVALCSADPLHPPAEPHRRRIPGLGVRSYALCADCRNAGGAELAGRVLRVERDGRPRPYFQASGVWRDTVARDLTGLAANVRESLGVE